MKPTPSNRTEPDEFYVGYRPQMPPGLARHMRRLCAVLLILPCLLAVVLVSSQRPFPRSVFEYQQYRTYEGRLRTAPYPALLVSASGQTTPAPYLLVAPGKHGAAADVAGHDEQRVRLQGALIEREGLKMLEILPASLLPLGREEEAAAEPVTLGVFTLRGEIVDSKCYLGVMNPGQGKPHRECAARCISGGIPPLLLAHDQTGRTAALLLVSATGAPVNQAVLDLVAEPVELTGEVKQAGAQLYLWADPATYRRWSK
jgi:hypothetical protein